LHADIANQEGMKMAVARHYVMIAAEGKEDALNAALVELAAKVRPITGCEGVELLRDTREPTYFMFIERWTSIDAHKAGGQSLGREALNDVMAAIAEPPKGRYLEYLPLA
jgi:quinol monooxygenase YgiN